MKQENATARAAIAALQADKERSDATAQFSETWTAAIAAGKATPGDRARKLALFLAQSNDVVSFGENTKTAREMFLEDIAVAPVVISFSEKAKPGAPASSGDNGDALMARVNAKTAELIKSGVDKVDAAIAAFSECGITEINAD